MERIESGSVEVVFNKVAESSSDISSRTCSAIFEKCTYQLCNKLAHVITSFLMVAIFFFAFHILLTVNSNWIVCFITCIPVDRV
jgi:hypothetical protein